MAPPPPPHVCCVPLRITARRAHVPRRSTLQYVATWCRHVTTRAVFVHRCSHPHATRCSGSLFAAPAFGRLRRRRRSVELLRRAHFADANAVCEVCVESLEDQGWVLPASSSVSPPPAWTHSRSCDECRAFPVVGPLFRSMWPPSKADMSDNTTFTPRARALDGGRAASRTWRYVARRGSSWRPLSLCGGCSLPGV